MKYAIVLLIVLSSFVYSQDKPKPDTTATVSLVKVAERVKIWQDRIAQIDKDIANLTIEKQQLTGAIAGMQITVTDSTLIHKKK